MALPKDHLDLADDALQAGTRLVWLSDGWVGIETFGGRRTQVSPKLWGEMRQERPALPDFRTLPREDGFTFSHIRGAPRRASEPPAVHPGLASRHAPGGLRSARRK